ncbi:nucleotide exchange factor GrpE [Campylobacter pinnipediorum]|uniref:Protein GrpE n=1 Tax=Campylobacter pinnipediorum subsp. pinnipediorum TaxID=1660067 RepID=A0AAX0LAP6_9BACT|nr:nucleotide exchange factor GrpE [Campylobacter pinnipediorum]AQW81021.1 DnaK system nucleotide exchange factor GrpE [Campylobacter pinnipediorum subsp. pinnipediorum]AQW82637.1 DnaK system nucleotide exchange factor GrpE [Campylobacter pinnipediorum subsp. pinnipediorum]AQW84323.1 DnaK system nucleotide exchange factor GrpE [Campylobacter pinnipediorum subsp. pinnipediorum]OPA78922.1 nucleotide exchange factor GrpE [Campylobacter pinnipediorum subsp. pinnipediorum]
MSEDIKQEENNLENVTDNKEITSDNIDLNNLSQEEFSKVLELEKELSELTNKYYRANADFENMKKRFEKEKEGIASYANEKFARDLLPVIDAMLMAVNFDASEDEFAKKIKEGVLLTLDEFKKCFEKHGIKEIQTDIDFDPNVHNAVLRVDSENHTSGQIVQVMQVGYTINGRVLRPAMVSIAN